MKTITLFRNKVLNLTYCCLFLFLGFSQEILAQSNEIYFDSNNTNDPLEDGSETHPYDLLTDFQFNTLVAGDKVFLKKDCTFNGKIDLPASVFGTITDQIIFDSYPEFGQSPGNKPIINGVVGGVSQDFSIRSRGDYIFVKNLNLTGGRFGIILSGAGFNQLIDLEIHDVQYAGIEVTYLFGFPIYSSNNIIDHCEIYNTGLYFVNFDSNGDGIPENKGYGVGSGIHIPHVNEGGHHNTIINCEIHHTPGLGSHSEHGIYDHGNNSTYINNYIHDIPGSGIKLKNTENVYGVVSGSYGLISCNKIERCHQGALHMEYGLDNVVINNSFIECGDGFSSYVQDADGIIDPTFSNRGCINYLYKSDALSTTSITITNNLFQNCGINYVLGQPNAGETTIGGILYDLMPDFGSNRGITASNNWYSGMPNLFLRQYNTENALTFDNYSYADVPTMMTPDPWVETNSSFNEICPIPVGSIISLGNTKLLNLQYQATVDFYTIEITKLNCFTDLPESVIFETFPNTGISHSFANLSNGDYIIRVKSICYINNCNDNLFLSESDFGTSLSFSINSFALPNQFIYYGDCIELGNDPIVGYTYSWYKNGFPNSNRYHTSKICVAPRETTTYILEVTELSTGCIFRDEIIVNVDFPEVILRPLCHCRQPINRGNALILFPNPAGSEGVTATFDGLILSDYSNPKLEIYNTNSGRKEKTIQLNGNSTRLQITTDDLHTGSHRVVIIANDQIITEGNLMIVR